MTDLDPNDRRHAMNVVFAVETALRALAAPDKINLAALGNMVPHLHWHVIARFDWDSHFPQAVWGPRQREVRPDALQRIGMALAELDACVVEALSAAG